MPMVQALLSSLPIQKDGHTVDYSTLRFESTTQATIARTRLLVVQSRVDGPPFAVSYTSRLEIAALPTDAGRAPGADA